MSSYQKSGSQNYNRKQKPSYGGRGISPIDAKSSQLMNSMPSLWRPIDDGIVAFDDFSMAIVNNTSKSMSPLVDMANSASLKPLNIEQFASLPPGTKLATENSEKEFMGYDADLIRMALTKLHPGDLQYDELAPFGEAGGRVLVLSDGDQRVVIAYCSLTQADTIVPFQDKKEYPSEPAPNPQEAITQTPNSPQAELPHPEEAPAPPAPKIRNPDPEDPYQGMGKEDMP